MADLEGCEGCQSTGQILKNFVTAEDLESMTKSRR